jgi:hypothetical protein
MRVGKVFVSGLKILAVCLLFAVCFVVGATLSGLTEIGQQPRPSKTVPQAPPAEQAASSLPEAPPQQQPPQLPENFLPTFLTFSVCVGVVLSYLILRSSWHGWPLVGVICVGMYGVSTVASQIESVVYLSNKVPRGMIRAIFLQGAIATVLFAPLAVLLLGKWRSASQVPPSSAPAPMRAPSVVWRLALIVVAFVFFYMFFGYYVAWQSPAVRQYYGGPEYSSFYAVLKANWAYHPWIYPLQVFRALLYTACLYPLIRMLRAARWETALAMALFLSAWTTALLLPNPMMPSSVAHAHFWETLGFSLVFGALAGWLLSTPRSTAAGSATAA